ncbi:MAG TPA: hypothetical protein VI365_27820 [Trebonia sp.]
MIAWPLAARHPITAPSPSLQQPPLQVCFRNTLASHTCGTRGSSSGPPQLSESNSASTATARRADALASLGCLRALSLSASRCALPSSSADISKSSSSSASSPSVKSRSPSARRISIWWSESVFARCAA